MDHRKLRRDEPLAIEFAAALKQGEPERLQRLLDDEPSLACCVVVDEKGGGRTPLHLFADWPGHCPNATAIVAILAAAGGDLNAPAIAMWHRETPLYWAASNDDVALTDALLDAGADIEHEGSSIDGGPPLSSAVGYGRWAAARKLVARGAKTQLWHEAKRSRGALKPILPCAARRFRDPSGTPATADSLLPRNICWRTAPILTGLRPGRDKRHATLPRKPDKATSRHGCAGWREARQARVNHRVLQGGRTGLPARKRQITVRPGSTSGPGQNRGPRRPDERSGRVDMPDHVGDDPIRHTAGSDGLSCGDDDAEAN
jgi:hypothetical protein